MSIPGPIRVPENELAAGTATAGDVPIATGTGFAAWGAASTASGAMVPYFIADGDTFTVPLYSQALYAMAIDNEGTLDVEGFLIEVD